MAGFSKDEEAELEIDDEGSWGRPAPLGFLPSTTFPAFLLLVPVPDSVLLAEIAFSLR